MEKELMNYEELTNYMKRIKESIEMSKNKQEEINKMQEELYEETKPMMVEKRKQEIEEKEEAKKEFDEMTLNAVKKANKEIKQIKEQSEKEYEQKLIESIEKEKRIKEKFENMKKRDLTEEKLIKANEFASKAIDNNKKDMEDFQTAHFKKRAELDGFAKIIKDYAIEKHIDLEELEKEELANAMAEGRKKAIEDREEAQIREAIEEDKEKLANAMAEGRKQVIEAREEAQIEEAKKEVQIEEEGNKEIEFSDEEIKETIGKLVSDMEKTEKNNKVEKGITINLKDKKAILVDEFENRKIDVPINRKQIGHLYYRTNINKLIKSVTGDKSIFGKYNLKRKIDPTIVSLLSNNEGKLLQYIESVYLNENFLNLPIKYDLRDADKKDLIAVSKYAKHVKEIAEIDGELAKGLIGRTIDGIKDISSKLFNKVKTLAPIKKVVALKEAEIENKEDLEKAEEEAKKLPREASIQFRNSLEIDNSNNEIEKNANQEMDRREQEQIKEESEIAE